ncbi:MAG TPA: UvrD-helicase domain-containing protein [Phycisphaerae bacterium]|nr:UvrD-helicase domain-containing protein [Phycisphaerae bacterium]
MTSLRNNQKTSWNPTTAQQKAISHHTGRMVVLAGAGSGKTAVLARRCAALVDHPDSPCSVDELLVVTFTIEAASEMRSRITAVLRDAALSAGTQTSRGRILAKQAALAPQAHVSTVHAFCAWVLRTWFNLCGVDPAFGLLDEVDAELLWTQSFRDSTRRRIQSNDAGFKTFFDLYANGDIAILQQLIEPIVNHLATLPKLKLDEWMDRVWAAAGPEQSLNKLVKLVQSDIEQLGVHLAQLRDDATFAADPKHIMTDNLELLQAKLAAASKVLGQKGFAAWDETRKILEDYKLTNVRLNDKSNDRQAADKFKKSFYEDAKDSYTKLYEKSVLAMTAEKIINAGQNAGAMVPALLGFVDTVIEDFRKLKRSHNQLDFSDLERLTVEALEKPDSQLADRLRRRFRHILFDEYQDINPLQQRLIELVARTDSSGSIFYVGDPAQSIYGFRGSRSDLLLEKVETFGQNGVVRMMENYRTLPPLIDAFNLIFPEVFKSVGEPKEPRLRHGRPANPREIQKAFTGAPLELHVICKDDAHSDKAGTDNAEPDQDSTADASAEDPDAADPTADYEIAEREALLVAEMIHEMLKSGRQIAENKKSDSKFRPIGYDDIAILMRSKKFKSTQVVRTLSEQGIPAYAEMTTGFFEAPEILSVLDLLHVLDNPAQDIPLASVLLGPLGNFSHTELVRIRQDFRDRHKTAFHDAVRKFSSKSHDDKVDQDIAQRLSELRGKLDQWRQIISALGVGEGLAHIYQTSGLLTSIVAQENGKQKLANLHLLRQKAMEYSGVSNEGLPGFTAFIRRLEEIDIGAAPVPAPGAVKVMSIHAAKGLEFPVVYLIGLGTQFYTRDLNQNLIVDDEGLGLQVFDQTDGGMVRTASPEYQIVKEARKIRMIQEEARLLYVAMTRTRDHLVLIGHTLDGRNKLTTRVKMSEIWSQLKKEKDVNRMLDWLGPIFSDEDELATQKNQLLKLGWHDASKIGKDNYTVPIRCEPSDPNWRAMRAGQTLPNPPPLDPDLQTVIRRITTPYPYQKFTELSAVTTVSKLKTLANDSDEFPTASFDPPEDFAPEIQSASTGMQRGTATHAVLQRLDLTADLSLAGIGAQIQRLAAGGQIPSDFAALADAEAIAWFFTTPTGKQMRELAAKKAANTAGVDILREQVFLWRNGINGNATNSDPSDAVLVRGAIDVLLIDNKNVRIIDYKTDAPVMIESRLPAYRKQVQYYARAAGEILKTPISSATLVFLSARRCEEVDIVPAF